MGELFAGRFRILREVARGGMGIVHEAEDTHSGDRVAIKRMLAEGAELSRFRREMELLAEIDHPALVRHVAHGIADDGAPYLAMQWLEGEDLSARLARGPISRDEAVQLGGLLSDALGALHARGVVHRDVKPANVFLIGGEIAGLRLLDLGVARAHHASTVLTAAGMALGTPAYMAPEQARGEPVDARADVFSWGCVIWECLVGHTPFQGDHALAVLMKVLVEEPLRADELGVADPALATVIARAMSKSAADRHENGSALRHAIERLRADSFVPPSRAAVVGTSERRVVSLAMTAGVDATEATLLPSERVDLETSARDAVALQAGVLQVLVNGAMIAVPARAAAPTDQAACAARCALALAAVSGGAPIALVTGLAVVAGRVPVGDAIDRAVEFTRAPGPHPHRVRVDDATAALIESRFEVAGEKERWLVAEREQVEVARLLLGRPTPFVGRDKELAMLLAGLDESAAESVARVIVVTAPAGTGKSRLVREFMRAAETRHADLEIVVARADSLGAGSPLAMAGQLVRCAAGVSEGDDADAKVRKLTARSARVAPEDIALTTELLREIAGVPVPNASASEALRGARQDALAMSDAVRSAWERWLDAECCAGPRVLVIEDLHWGDRPTVQLVDAALRFAADRPLFVVATARPEVDEVFPNLWAERAATAVRLGAVSKSASERLVRGVLGAGAATEQLRMIVERAAGHPFLLEELIRAVAEGRADQTLPEGVLGIIQLRLDALPPSARRVLRAASVFGETFSREGLAVLLGSDDELGSIVDDLVARELVGTSGGARADARGDLVFRHALVRDAAYAMLPEVDRVHAHALAGEWLEQRGDADALRLAEHFDRGGRPNRAVAWYHRAAEQALEGSDPRGVIERAERAIACGAEGEVLGSLERLCAEAHVWRAELQAARTRAEAAASRLSEGTAAWYQAVGAIVFASGQSGDNATAERWTRRAAMLEPSAESLDAQVVCVCQGLNQLVWTPNAQAVADLDARLGVLTSGGIDRLHPLAVGWIHRVRFLRLLLRQLPGTARAHATAAVEAFERAGARRLAALVKTFRACIVVSFDPESAMRDIAEAKATGEALGAAYITGIAGMYEVFVLLCSGKFAEAEKLGAALAERVAESPRVRLSCVLWSAVAAMLQGNFGRFGEALEDMGAVKVPSLRGLPDFTRAKMALALGDLEGARAHVSRAKEVAGLPPYPRFPGGVGGLEWDLFVAEVFAAVGEDELARVVMRPALAMVRIAWGDLHDPLEQRRLLECPWPWRGLVELGERLGLSIHDSTVG